VPVKASFAFGKIVCAVNRSRGADEAAYQAIRLVGPADELTFVAVCDVQGAQSGLSAGDAAAAVDSAALLLHAPDIGAALADVTAGAGLLVLGAHGHSRSAGILLGEITSRAVREIPVPVLVARGQREVGFPGMVLVGTKGTGDGHAVEVAATIAARHDASVVLGHVRRNGDDLRSVLAEQADIVLEITGTEPVIVSVDGDPVARLLAMVKSIGAGLVVLGARGTRGVPSVPERIAHRAESSVLVLRAPDALTHLHPRARSTA
jgi:nucleotide-binding universal stress UspA family protein